MVPAARKGISWNGERLPGLPLLSVLVLAHQRPGVAHRVLAVAGLEYVQRRGEFLLAHLPQRVFQQGELAPTLPVFLAPGASPTSITVGLGLLFPNTTPAAPFSTP